MNELGEKWDSGLEVRNFDEFVGGVSLVDRAGADADRGKAGIVEMGSIGEPGGADELAFGEGGGQLFEPRMVGADVHGWSFAGLGDGEGEAVLGDQFLQEVFGSAVLLEIGGEADVEGGFGVVGHDVGAAAAGDGADVESGMAEDRVGVSGEAVGELAIEEVEGGGELQNRVFAEVRLGGVGGLAGGLDGGP